MKQRTGIFVTFGVAMVFLVIAAIAMAWVEIGTPHPHHNPNLHPSL